MVINKHSAYPQITALLHGINDEYMQPSDTNIKVKNKVG
jgi:hypothetical protein